jgi:hypothetical protein
MSGSGFVSLRNLHVWSALLMGAICWGGTVASATEDETKEPPLTYTVKVGDKAVTLLEGEEGEIEGTLTNPKIAIELAPHRVFSAKGVTFKYPRSFTFEHEKEGIIFSGWTMSGNDFTIMMFATIVALPPEMQAKGMVEQFGKENCTVSNTTKELGGKTLVGKRILANIAGSEVTVDILQLPPKGGVHRLIAFQDMKEDDGQPSKEGKDALKTISETLQVE